MNTAVIESKPCANCNKIFYKKPSETGFKDRKFCSQKCYHENRKANKVFVDNKKLIDHRLSVKKDRAKSFLLDNQNQWKSTTEISQNTGIPYKDTGSFMEAIANKHPNIFIDIVFTTERKYQLYFGWFANKKLAIKAPVRIENYIRRSIEN